jgi:hypothetical protein
MQGLPACVRAPCVLVSAPRRNELVLSGRGDEIVDLQKLIFLGRREGLSALAIRLLP